MSGLATPGDHLLQPSFRLIVIFIMVIPRRALPIVVCSTDEQTSAPAFAIPLRTSKSWRPSVAGLKSMLVPNKRPLLEISSCAHARW
jgi:hypothetical protein